MRSVRSAFVGSPFFLLTITVWSGCAGDGPTNPPDEGSPLIGVVFPTSATAFDRDEDGLVDLEVGFVDPGSGIDPSTIRLTSGRPVKGPAGNGADLLEFWTVVRADSAGLVIEETVDNLLPRGEVGLTVAVADRAGNAMKRTITVELPPAVRHKVIDLQASLKFNTSQITLSPDGRLAYVTTEGFGGSFLSIVDLESLEWRKTIPSDIAALSTTVLDEARGRLYLVSIDEPRVAVFDLASESFLAPILTSGRGIGAALSVRRDELYIGLEVELFGDPNGSTALVSLVDVAQGKEEDVIDLGVPNPVNPGDRLGMEDMILTDGDERLWVLTRSNTSQGVLIVDPVAWDLLGQVDLRPETENLGGGEDFDLIDGIFAVTSLSPSGAGRIAVFPEDDPAIVRFGEVGQFQVPLELAASPDGSEWAISVGDQGAGFTTLQLMDATTLEVIWEERLERELDQDPPRDIAFRPDGQAFLVAFSGPAPRPVPSELLVYLYR